MKTNHFLALKYCILKYTVFLFIFAVSSLAQANEYQLPLIRKIAVFPTADAQTSLAEDAWWQSRELLAKDQKFLVASRRFMINRGAFQPRKSLKPADAIILAKILDAEALITTWVQDRVMYLHVYEGVNGMLIWKGESAFHPAISINEQLIKANLRLMNNFLIDVPYHGFQITDPVIGKALYEKNEKRFAQVFIGTEQKIEVGDTAQWIEAEGNLNSLKLVIIAEGVVTEIKKDSVEVEITKLRSADDLVDNALVRFPSQIKKQQDQRLSDDKTANLTTEYLSTEVKNANEVYKQTHPTATALAFIVNIGTLLLLGF
jgi:hypothetical protein